MQETRVWFLGQEDSLEKEIATHSSTLVWEIPWTEEPGGLQSMGSQRIKHSWATNTVFPLIISWFPLKEWRRKVPLGTDHSDTRLLQHRFPFRGLSCDSDTSQQLSWKVEQSWGSEGTASGPPPPLWSLTSFLLKGLQQLDVPHATQMSATCFVSHSTNYSQSGVHWAQVLPWWAGHTHALHK